LALPFAMQSAANSKYSGERVCTTPAETVVATRLCRRTGAGLLDLMPGTKGFDPASQSRGFGLPARCSDASHAPPAGSTGKLVRLRRRLPLRSATGYPPACAAALAHRRPGLCQRPRISVTAASAAFAPHGVARSADACQAIPSRALRPAYIPITPRSLTRH
jgi:hypothetical protein